MPFVAFDFLKWMVGESSKTSAMVIIPKTTRGFEPLCAVYRRDFSDVAERALKEGRNKIDPLFAEVSTRIIESAELFRQGFSEEMFRNLNTPEDWQSAVGK
jgi:molybdopterin-guanine dinucleotide biosynthesis protein A